MYNHRENRKTYNIKSIIVLLVFFLIAVLLRILAALDNFWLDEIWTYYIVNQISYPWELITKLKHDNNHILTSLYMFLLGDIKNWLWYRVLSIITGSASVLALWFIAIKRGFLEAVITVILATFSYMLILYSSEARGYAPAIFFSLTSFLLIQGYWENKKAWKLVLFWISTILAFLSHLTVLFVYSAIFLWTIFREYKKGEYFSIFSKLLIYHAVPLIFLSTIYIIFIKDIVIGGGPAFTNIEVGRQLLFLTLGIEKQGLLGFFGISILFLIFTTGVIKLLKESSYEWIFFVSVLLVAPILSITVIKPTHLYFRYFLVCIPFLYLLSGYVFASIFKHSSSGKLISVFLILLFLWGNSIAIYKLLVLGRGNYFNAVSYMAEKTVGTDIVVGSDHDFRNAIVLSFYGRYLPAGKRIIYITQDHLSDREPDWFILHNLDTESIPSEKIRISLIRNSLAGVFTLSKIYKYSGISGFNWFVYRNDLSLEKNKISE